MKFWRHPSREPLWREEISIFSDEEHYVNRRQFAKFLVLSSLGMLVGNLWILVRSWFAETPAYPVTQVARVGELAVGGVKLFRYPGNEDPCILIRRGPEEYLAYSQKCTHLSCAVYFSSETDRLVCPCHAGYFSGRDGRVLQGPPQRPLPRILLERRGDVLLAVGVDPQREV